MIDYNNKRPLISIHIPKCGGTSFKNILQNWFGDKLYLHYFDEINNTRPKKIKLKNTITGKYNSDICIHGHFNSRREFGISDYYPEIEQFIAIVRDPVDIQISQYYHWKKQQSTGNDYWAGEKIEFEYHDLNEFLERTESVMLLHFPVKITGENYKECIDSKFIHIGMVEEFQRSVNVIADKLGKPRIRISHENSSPGSEIPSPASIIKFKEKSKLEYKVYDYIAKLCR